MENPTALLCASVALSAFALLAAHGFEKFGNLAPCLLCLDQREVYWVAGFTALGVLAVQSWGKYPRWVMAGIVLLVMVFFYGAMLAFYHAGVEWKFWPGPAACSATSVEIIDTTGGLSLDMDDVHFGPSCTEAAWRLFGLSMAGYNGLISLAMTFVLGWGLWRMRKPFRTQ